MISERLHGISETLYPDRRSGQEITGTILERFHAARGNVARAYALSQDIRDNSKLGIKALREGDHAKLVGCGEFMRARYDELAMLDLPEDIKWQHKAEAGQEMVEFFATCWLYPAVFGGDQEGAFFSAESYKVTPQCWLAGIGDAVGEIGKLLTDRLCDGGLSREERIELRRRFIAAAKEVLAYFDQYCGCVKQIINNNRHPEFGSGFRGMVGRLTVMVQREQEKLVQVLDSIAS